MAKKLNYEVLEVVGTLSSKEYDRTNYETKEKEHVIETKEFRKVKWGENPPKYEIRTWYYVGNEETSGKGITLDDTEFDTLNFMFASME